MLTNNEHRSQTYFKILWIGVSFLSALLICLSLVHNFLLRKAVINHFKQEMVYVIKSLNQSGWDVAYDHISFSAFYPFKLVSIENFKLYSLYQNRSLNLEKLFLTSSFFSPEALTFSNEGRIDFVFDGTIHKIHFSDSDIAIDLRNNDTPNNFTFQLKNLNISDWAEVNEVNLAARIIAPQPINQQAPFIRAHADIRQIKLNGLLDYPLGQNIEHLYSSAEIIGQINTQKDFKQELREWLSHDGHVDIKEFTLSWSPLLMVGKGALSFNEDFKPVLELNTSSKGLFELIDSLEQKEWLDRKGTFVAKILLNNKAYKANPDDEHLTVTTPISIQDDALLIEKIAVKKL